jgi:hypothetical protein
LIFTWGGAQLRDFLRLAGAEKDARYLAVESADDYSTSYDMPSAMHPQTLLCYEAYRKPLTIWNFDIPDAFTLGGWLAGARMWHFFGHLLMVVLAGWANFFSIITGWKKGSVPAHRAKT